MRNQMLRISFLILETFYRWVQNILEKFFVLNFKCSPIFRRKIISPATNNFIKTPYYTHNYLQKYSCIRPVLPWIIYIIETKLPYLVWIAVISRKLSCYEVYGNIGMHQSSRKVWPDESVDIIVMLRCFVRKLSGRKTKERNLNN